jgi:FAD-linked oxidoreductase
MNSTPSSVSRRHALTGTAALAIFDALRGGTLAQLVLPGAHAQGATPGGAATSQRRWQNWSGLQHATPANWATPATEAQVQQLLRSTKGEIRPAGSAHSFTALVPTSANLVSLDRLASVIQIDKTKMTVTAQAGMRIGALARALDAQGLALRNQPDVDVQTLAGAISTGTHGTGAQLPALHDDVVGMRLVKADGSVVSIQVDQDPDLMAAARVSLGSLGLITQLTLRVVPAFDLARHVWLQPLEQLIHEAPQLAAKHRHFEFYVLPHTGYAAGIRHDVYTGTNLLLPQSGGEDVLGDLKMLRDWLGRFPKLRRWAAQQAIDPNMTEEARHRSFRLLSSVRPTRFNETEWHLPRERALNCLKEVVSKLESRNEVFFPLEFRFVRRDEAWLSPFHDQDCCSIAIHTAADEPWQYLIDDFTPIFRAHRGRPHWGKLHNLRETELSKMYPRWDEFQAVRRRFDPHDRLLNAHLRQVFGRG